MEMSRYIDADALCKELKKRQNAAYNWLSESRAINDLESEIRSDAALAMLSEVKLTIEAQPTANVRENVTGKWIEKEVCDDSKVITEWQSARCSNCGLYHTTPYMYYFDNYKYCPNCGADNRGEKE